MIVLVYDITNPASFNYLSVWMQTISNIIESPPITAVIGNKGSLKQNKIDQNHRFVTILGDSEHQRVVRKDKVLQFVRDYELFNYVMSAKTGESVSFRLFQAIVITASSCRLQLI